MPTVTIESPKIEDVDVKRSLVKEVKVLKQKVRKYNQEINKD